MYPPIVPTLLGPGYEDAAYVYCPIVEQLHEVPKYAHPAVPTSIADALSHLHGAPPVWVSGHLLAYLMRLRSGAISESVERLIRSIRGTSDSTPIVGVHIRRTDKVQFSTRNPLNSNPLLHFSHFMIISSHFLIGYLRHHFCIIHLSISVRCFNSELSDACYLTL